VCPKKDNNNKVMHHYTMYEKNVKMHAKAFKQSIIHRKKTTHSIKKNIYQA